jgi:hypothetical protein
MVTSTILTHPYIRKPLSLRGLIKRGVLLYTIIRVPAPLAQQNSRTFQGLFKDPNSKFKDLLNKKIHTYISTKGFQWVLGFSGLGNL